MRSVRSRAVNSNNSKKKDGCSQDVPEANLIAVFDEWRICQDIQPARGLFLEPKGANTNPSRQSPYWGIMNRAV